MLQLNGKTLQLGKAFVTEDGRQFPANFLDLSTSEEKESIGIVEVEDPVFPVFDTRFFYGVDTPKQLEDVTDEDGNTSVGLKTTWKQAQDEAAASLLAPSDWRVVKAAELGTTVASKWLTYRGAVRSACNTRQSEISAVTSVEALRELFFGSPQIEQTDSEGNSSIIDNPGLATPWPQPPA